MKFNLIAFLFLVSMISACQQTEPVRKVLDDRGLIPLPAEITPVPGNAFVLNAKTQISYDSEEYAPTAALFSKEIKALTGLSLSFASGESTKGNIQMKQVADMEKEAYEIEISENQILLKTSSNTGMYFGTQTLVQLLEHGVIRLEDGKAIWAIGAGSIKDEPRFAYRGSMLDVARHFFSPTEVKRYIDYLARYKMNVLHLHLADDQGWRIEIKSWPKLTEIGGKTEVGGAVGGFYTQEEYKDLVAYAAERQIMIIPEIDMPGHTNAALASYPELNCDGKSPELYTGTEVGFSTLCTDKEVVYQFVDDVLRELAELTPGPYLHIGGDESHVTAKPDYIKFINRVQAIVKKHNKQMIGWDEITLANLEEGAIAQYWASPENAKAALDKKAALIISPAKYAYLDMKYDSTTKLGLRWAGLIEVDQGYSWDPAELEEGLGDENILGIEAPLWSETVSNLEEVDFLTFPRLPGYAEIGWTAKSKRDWNSYRQRLANEKTFFERMGINYYASPKVPWDEPKPDLLH